MSAPDRLPENPVERARRAASFGLVADAYEHGRPGYPATAVAFALGRKRRRVADIGAGTGKLTRALLQAGHEVVAVEPLEEMRAVLAAQLPAALALEGRAEALPLGERSVDAVVAGAAFHWFERERALAEIARVLRGEGVLALFGNGFDEDAAAAPWVARLREILGRGPLGRRGHWPAPEELAERFTAVEQAEFAHGVPVTLASLGDLVRSRSRFAVMTEAERAPTLAAIEQLWREQVRAERAVLPYRARVLRAVGLRAR